MQNIQIKKEVVKLSLYASHIILYVENPKVSLQILLEFNKWIQQGSSVQY